MLTVVNLWLIGGPLTNDHTRPTVFVYCFSFFSLFFSFLVLCVFFRSRLMYHTEPEKKNAFRRTSISNKTNILSHRNVYLACWLVRPCQQCVLCIVCQMYSEAPRYWSARLDRLSFPSSVRRHNEYKLKCNRFFRCHREPCSRFRPHRLHCINAANCYRYRT